MVAWISVPPAVVMAIMTWINKTFALNLTTVAMVSCAAVLLVLYFLMSIQNVQFLVKATGQKKQIHITIFNFTVKLNRHQPRINKVDRKEKVYCR